MTKKSLFFDNFISGAPESRDVASVSTATRRHIRRGVLIAHASLIILPMVWWLVPSPVSKPRLKTIKVSIVSPSAVPATAVSTTTSIKHPTTSTPPPLRHKRPTRHTKPKWQPKKANQITVSRQIVKKTSAARPKPQTTPKTLSAAQIEARLKAAASKSVRRSSPNISNSPLGGTVSNNYREKLYAAIYALWRQPSKAELKGRCPSTDISFTVNASGSVSKPRISRRSGNPAMDASVKRLLQNLRFLPPAPQGAISLTVTLEIVD